ncbi:MAG: hypothetical protein AAF191_09515, partial [Verrucomicrobiota bacterium]
ARKAHHKPKISKMVLNIAASHLHYKKRRRLSLSKIKLDGSLYLASFDSAKLNFEDNKYDIRSTVDGSAVKAIGLTGKFEVKF